MLKIVRQAVLERLAFFRLVLHDFAHPKPGFRQHIVIVADVDGTVQITAGAFAVAGLCIYDSTFEKLPAVVAEHNVSNVVKRASSAFAIAHSAQREESSQSHPSFLPRAPLPL